MSKLEKLCEAYEKFGLAIATVPDDKAKALSSNSLGVRQFASEARARIPKPTPSQIASGLEQGWRETLELIQCISVPWRTMASQAWHNATLEVYPEFLAMERQRLDKVLERGKIRTEAEFYRIRHEVDVLEGRPESGVELQRLYSLIDAYEVR